MDIITRQYAPYLQCTYATLEASTYYHHLFFPCLEMQAVWRKNGPIIVELSGTLCHHIAFMTDHDTSPFLFCLPLDPELCVQKSLYQILVRPVNTYFHVFLPSFCLPLIEKYLQSLLHNIREFISSLPLVYHKPHLTIFG